MKKQKLEKFIHPGMAGSPVEPSGVPTSLGSVLSFPRMAVLFYTQSKEETQSRDALVLVRC